MVLVLILYIEAYYPLEWNCVMTEFSYWDFLYYCLQFIGACKDSNMVIVTELLMGGSLKKFLRALRPSCLDLQLAVSFALDISRAMECLHANGIIHRDLKPGNLLGLQQYLNFPLKFISIIKQKEKRINVGELLRWLCLFMKILITCANYIVSIPCDSGSEGKWWLLCSSNWMPLKYLLPTIVILYQDFISFFVYHSFIPKWLDCRMNFLCMIQFPLEICQKLVIRCSDILEQPVFNLV